MSTTSHPSLTLEEQALAKSTVAAIVRSGHFRLESDGSTYSLPSDAARIIVNMLGLMAEGQPVEIVPAQSELTVHQAAMFLGMSEERLNKFLDRGEIKYRQDKNDRLVNRESLLDFEREIREMDNACSEITRMSQEMGLYDD